MAVVDADYAAAINVSRRCIAYGTQPTHAEHKANIGVIKDAVARLATINPSVTTVVSNQATLASAVSGINSANTTVQSDKTAINTTVGQLNTEISVQIAALQELGVLDLVTTYMTVIDTADAAISAKLSPVVTDTSDLVTSVATLNTNNTTLQTSSTSLASSVTTLTADNPTVPAYVVSPVADG